MSLQNRKGVHSCVKAVGKLCYEDEERHEAC